MVNLYRIVFLIGLVLKTAVAADELKDLVDPREEFERVQKVIRDKGVSIDVLIDPITVDYINRTNEQLASYRFHSTERELYGTELFCWYHWGFTKILGQIIQSMLKDSPLQDSELLSSLNSLKNRRHAFLRLVILLQKSRQRERSRERKNYKYLWRQDEKKLHERI